jgi:hypothetical protein
LKHQEDKKREILEKGRKSETLTAGWARLGVGENRNRRGDFSDIFTAKIPVSNTDL